MAENYEKISVESKKIIPLEDMLAFVNDVVSSCVDIDSGEYIPEAYDFAYRAGVLSYYGGIELPSSTEEKYMYVYAYSDYDNIRNSANEEQLVAIMCAIDEKIKFMIDVIASSAVAKINEVIHKFNDIASSMESMFGNASDRDISGITEMITKLSGLSEKDIAKIILESKK